MWTSTARLTGFQSGQRNAKGNLDRLVSLKDDMEERTMYKKLVQEIIDITDKDSFCRVCGDINRAFENGKISYKDHEQLFDLISFVERGKGIDD